MKFYVIAGEASGDLHGSNLLKNIRKIQPDSEFRAWGGDLMEDQGAHIVKHYRDLAFMGFIEVLLNIRTILRNIKFCKKDILDFKPDVLILIDYPGFNLRIAEFAKENNIKVFYYISPQIWAWKENRVHKIKRNVDRMYVILPFEKAFYKKHDFDVEYLGHPLLDVISPHSKPQDEIKEFKKEFHLDEREIILLVPGSRKQEISNILPEMVKIIQEFPSYQFVIAGAPNIDRGYYKSFSKEVKVVSNRTRDLYKISKLGLIASGTATLEAGLSRLPQVVCYKGSAISVWIARRLIKIKYISLVNLIADKPVVTELIQGELNVKNLKTEMKLLLEDSDRIEQIHREYDEIIRDLGHSGSSNRIAIDMLKSLETGQ